MRKHLIDHRFLILGRKQGNFNAEAPKLSTQSRAGRARVPLVPITAKNRLRFSAWGPHPQIRNGAASNRNGSVIAKNTTSNTPCTATPTIRNGNNNNHTNGYAINATSAKGQQRTNRTHHNRKVNIAETSVYLKIRAPRPDCSPSRARLKILSTNS